MEFRSAYADGNNWGILPTVKYKSVPCMTFDEALNKLLSPLAKLHEDRKHIKIEDLSNHISCCYRDMHNAYLTLLAKGQTAGARPEYHVWGGA